MSYAKRTQNALYPIKAELGGHDLVSAEFADGLERENDQLAKQCVKNVEEIGQLRAALDASESKAAQVQCVLQSWSEDEGADAARLAWLMNHAGGVVINLDDNFLTREEIDEAMEAANNE